MTAEVIVPEATHASSTGHSAPSLGADDTVHTSGGQPSEQTIPAEIVESLLKEPVPEPATKPHKYVLPEISLVDRHVDEPRKLRVAVIGAGLSGVIAGVLLPIKVPGIELTIFEKNADVVSEPRYLLVDTSRRLTTDHRCEGRYMVRECLPRCPL